MRGVASLGNFPCYLVSNDPKVKSIEDFTGKVIFQNRNELYTDRVFAGLATVILIGLLVEGLVFTMLERLTVRRWGMQH